MIKFISFFGFILFLFSIGSSHAVDFHEVADSGDLRIHIVASRMSGGLHLVNPEETVKAQSLVFFQVQVYLENTSEASPISFALGSDPVISGACIVTALYRVFPEKDIFGVYLKPPPADLRIIELLPGERALLNRFRLFRRCETENVTMIVSYRVSSQIAEFYPVWFGEASAKLYLDFQ